MYTVDIIQSVCWNDDPEYFKISIESMIRQTYEIKEYIIVRDGPLRESQLEIISKYHKHLTIIDNIGKRGLPGSLNSAINYSSSEILVRMDSDDISRSDRVEALISEFERDQQLLAVGSAAIEIDSQGNQFFLKTMPKTPEKIAEMALTRSPFIHQSVAFRKDFFVIVGLYNENYKKAQDYELWARVITKYPQVLKRMKNIDQQLITVRLPKNFWDKRAFQNILYGTPISFNLICHYRAYHKLFPLFLKVVLRLSPSFIKRISYRRFR